jgi:hypothetical protein
MKKGLIAGVVGVLAVLATSCGGGHGTCDAYRTSDYTKYKAQKNLTKEFKEIITINKK